MPPLRSPLLRPPALKPGDLIGVAAPASPFPPDRFQTGLEILRGMGFVVECPPEIFAQDGYLAGSDQQRATVLNRHLGAAGPQAVLAARGGYGCLRLLDRIDIQKLLYHPRILLGFSDLTALFLDLYRRIGLVTLHGPVVTSLAEADPETLDHLARMLTGKRVFPLELDRAAIAPGRAEGPLLGGNLTMIVHLLAAGRLPDLTGAILFIEDVTEAPYRLDRMLTTLRLAGVLDRLAGLALGLFTDCGPPDEIRLVFERNLSHFPGPVLMGLPIGHGSRNLALPVGPRAVLDATSATLDVLEPFLS